MFEIKGIEAEKYEKWIQEHDKICPHKDPMVQGAIGGRLTYCFTPTSLGVITRVKCGCGDEIDITCYDW